MVLQINHVWFLNSGLNKSDVFHRDVFIVFIVFIFSTLKMTNISHKQLKTFQAPETSRVIKVVSHEGTNPCD